MALLLTLIVAPSCKNKNSYSAQLKSEKALINDYIKRKGIEIIYEAPAYDDWVKPEFKNKYLEVAEYCYFHLNVPGDKADSLAFKDKVLVRYRRYTLGLEPDTLSFWNTNELPYPQEVQYLVNTELSCQGWQDALEQMKYSGAEATVIVPSKRGFPTDASTVTPYAYDLKIQKKPY